MKTSLSILIAVTGAIGSSVSSLQAQALTEQNSFDRFAIDIQRDGRTGSGQGGGSESQAGQEEYFEFVNTSASTLNLNGYVFKDTDLAAPALGTDNVNNTYDFAFGAATGVSLATGQGLVITAAGIAGNLNGGATFRPRNFGGSILYTKNQSFVTTNTTIPNGIGGARTVVRDGNLPSIGISTTNDAIAVYNGTSGSSSLVATGPTSGTSLSPQASFLRTGDTATGAAIAHPSLGGVRASPGIRSTGASFVTPTQAVAKVSGIGILTGSANTWAVDFGSVNVGDTVTLTLSLGNNAGLGGVLSAISNASVTSGTNITITGGASQTLRFLGGESTATPRCALFPARSREARTPTRRPARGGEAEAADLISNFE